MSSTIQLSIVIPTSREKSDGYLVKILNNYLRDPKIEYIVADFRSEDELFSKMTREDVSILKTDQPNRGGRLQQGLEKAKGNIILLHHPRSLLQAGAIEYLLAHQSELGWGGFTHKFDMESMGLRFTSWYSNNVRPLTSSVLYLDHCIFFKRELMDRPIPDIPIFEDTEISKTLRRHGKPEILPYLSETSAIRFRANGFLRQGLKNQYMKAAYFLGLSKDKMNDSYEKDLNLNG